jgi:hypothetical protein
VTRIPFTVELRRPAQVDRPAELAAPTGTFFEQWIPATRADRREIASAVPRDQRRATRVSVEHIPVVRERLVPGDEGADQPERVRDEGLELRRLAL